MTERRRLGVIVKGVGGLYYAMDDRGDVSVLRAKGAFRRLGVSPLIGDSVRFTPGAGEGHGWIEEILPRVNELVRPPVANIGHLIFVLAPEPEPDLSLADTLLVMARRQRIAAALVVNKRDLDETLAPRIRAEYAQADVPVLETSTKTGFGLDALAKLLRDGVCCLAGQSGVGKSTLLTAVTGLSLQSGEISRKTAHGKHTTRHAELMVKDGYRVLDTAGFSLLELGKPMEPALLATFYPEFAPYEGRCRFSPCYHAGDSGCAVAEAVRRGELSAGRVDRYRHLLEKVRRNWRNRYE
jgi:ribosome biogenesis GTPase / thiamine phosphate phosphatase